MHTFHACQTKYTAPRRSTAGKCAFVKRLSLCVPQKGCESYDELRDAIGEALPDFQLNGFSSVVCLNFEPKPRNCSSKPRRHPSRRGGGLLEAALEPAQKVFNPSGVHARFGLRDTSCFGRCPWLAQGHVGGVHGPEQPSQIADTLQRVVMEASVVLGVRNALHSFGDKRSGRHRMLIACRRALNGQTLRTDSRRQESLCSLASPRETKSSSWQMKNHVRMHNCVSTSRPISISYIYIIYLYIYIYIYICVGRVLVTT